MTPRPPRLLDIAEGIYVAGTHDVHTALQILTAEHSSFEDYDREDLDRSEETIREIGVEVAARLHELFNTALTDWVRIIPALRGNCACGDGHAWDIYPARAGSPGAFRVVWWA